MLRSLRIIGIIVFAFLIGLSTYFLQQINRSGALLEGYSSAWRSSVTLLVFSVIGFSLSGYIEMHLLRERRPYRIRSSDEGATVPVRAGANSGNIYSAPKTREKWQGHRSRTSKRNHLKSHQSTLFWLRLLRLISFSTPVAYIFLFIICLTGPSNGLPMLCGIYGFMLVLSLVSVAGIMGGEAWGLVLGYAIALIHLFAFPAGTVAGLILLVSLVGATPWFVLSSSEQRREVRKKGNRKSRAT